MHAIRRDFLPDDVVPALHAASIDAVVAVQASQTIAETDFLLSLAASHPFIRGVVGWTDLTSATLCDDVARWRNQSVLKGFRHVVQSEPNNFLARAEVVSGVQQLGEMGYSYDLLVYPRQLPAAIDLVAQSPDVTFILDHCAKPSIASRNFREWAQHLDELAQYPNVTCKLSGLVTEASWHAWTQSDFTDCLDVVLRAFGPDRLMFASDWPVCLLSATYAETFDVIDTWSTSLTDFQRECIFGVTAHRVYRLDT